MPRSKIRAEFGDKQGNKYSISFQGRITREKALRLLDIVELLGGMREFGDKPEWHRKRKMTKFEKIQLIIERHFPLSWFSSKEIQQVYEDEYNEPIPLSTASTYLSRLAARDFLVRKKRRRRIRYRLSAGILKSHWAKEKPSEKVSLRLRSR